MNADKDDSNNPNRTSLKDEIIELIRHDEVDELFQRFLTHAKKSHRSKAITSAIVIFLGFLIGVGAFYLAYQASRNEAVVASKRAYDQARASNVEATIRRKIQWMKRGNKAIINMRLVRLHITLRCKTKKPYTPERQTLMRTNARFSVAMAFTGSRFVFNDTVEKKLDALTAFDENIKDVCAKDAPRDAKWRKYLIEIDNLMGKSIKKDQKLLIELNR